MILQNAMQCPDGTILVSTHVHDLQIHDGYFVDGGHDYFRRGGSLGKTKNLGLTTANSIDEIRDNLVWGTLLKKGRTQYIKYVKLIDCETSHLQAILKTQLMLAPLHNFIIRLILDERASK